jgi:hypothetical protein
VAFGLRFRQRGDVIARRCVEVVGNLLGRGRLVNPALRFSGGNPSATPVSGKVALMGNVMGIDFRQQRNLRSKTWTERPRVSRAAIEARGAVAP